MGPKRAKLFERIGAPSVGALLRLYPRAYQDMTAPYPIRQAPLNEPCAIRATLYRPPTETRVRGGMLLCKCRVTDGESDLEITFFNNPYVKDRLIEGESYLFYGKVSANFLKREMLSPEFYPEASCPAIIPIYRQTQGLSSRMIANAVKNAFCSSRGICATPSRNRCEGSNSFGRSGMPWRRSTFPARWTAFEAHAAV